jgi:small subunit ribosomal protein S6
MADRRYETLVLIHPDQGEPGAKEVAGRIQALMEQQGCTVTQVQEWGIRELAYLVAKQRRGAYVLFEFRSTPKALAEIERNLKLMEPVLRFVSLQQAENAPPTPPRAVRRTEREEGETDPGAEFEGLGDGEGV